LQCSIDELGGSSMTRLGRSPWQNGNLFARSVRFANSLLRNCAECGGVMGAYGLDSESLLLEDPQKPLIS
jgi:hypothetical protein